MNQIKRIIRTNLSKALALSAFALSILITASVAVASRESGRAVNSTRQKYLSYTQIDHQNAKGTGAFGYDAPQNLDR
jgi:hypothetical protein